MIKLLGFPMSNYFNMVKAVLNEKNIDFEEVAAPPSQEEDFLVKSPMGKVPCLEVDGRYLTESIPIIEYLEELSGEVPLLPADIFERAKVRELSQAMELNVELVSRTGISAAFGRDVSEDVKRRLKRDLPKGCAALARLTKFSPWIAGDQLTYADFVGYFSMGLANRLAKMNVEIDLFELLPGSTDWFAKVGDLDSVKKVNAEQSAR
jgi:glutathione S-transferase|tara:strand:- start:42972 stop:43592 length:621 start_codon:yes stop_codon:yes gene_type:complete